MDQILRQVARARRKLYLELFLRRLVRCWFVALAMAVVAIALPKMVAIENLSPHWVRWSILGSLLTGTVAALAWTWWRGHTTLEAAIEIDRRYDLRERVASSLSLDPHDLQTPAGQALLADALRAVQKIDVDKRFPIRLGRRAWLPLVPALLAFLLATLVDNREAQSRVDPQARKITKQVQDNTAKALRKRMLERRKQAAKAGLKDAEALFRELEKGAEKLQDKNTVDRKQVLVKLNDLAKQLAERRQKLGGDKELRKQLDQMKNLSRGPADKLAGAMKQGQWQTAMRELEKLRKQIADGKLDAGAKKELQQQFKQMQEKLQAAVDARKQAMDNLKKQIAKEKQQGNLSKAGELQQKLDQMAQQQNRMNKLQQLAQQMGRGQQALQQGDNQGAAEAMAQMAQQMEQLQQELAESELLDAAMDQLQIAKEAMNGQACDKCQGAGCQACQGTGCKGGICKSGGMSDRFSEQGGNGMGAARGGFGPRPDEKNDTKFRDSRVQQKTGRGAAVVVGEADGPNVRGKVAEAIKQEMASQGGEPADPLVHEQLPRDRREHTEEYFNRLREGR